jgi:UrcA family protein
MGAFRSLRLIVPTAVMAAAIALPAAAVELSPARASGAPAQPISVSFADLDLESAEGASTLRARVRHAALRSCGELDEKASSQARAAHQSCRNEAAAAAIAELERRGALEPAVTFERVVALR